MAGQRTGSTANAIGSATPMQPTCVGFVGTTMDSVVLIEACLQGKLAHVGRRPQDRERSDLIKSGYVYIYEEHSSGIKRWTDGVTWSPSRILGNFLIYRELSEPFPPGEKKRAAKRPKKPSTAGIVKPEAGDESGLNGTTSPLGGGPARRPTAAGHSELERSVYGSLIDSYDFKPDGLVKKTISIQYRGVTHHLVSYYTAEDVVSGKLQRPSANPELASLVPRPELLLSQNFRAPVEMSEMNQAAAQNMHYWALANAQQNQINSPWGRSMSTPTIVPSYNNMPFAASPNEDLRMAWSGLPTYGQVPNQQAQAMHQVYDPNYHHGLPQDFSQAMALAHNAYVMHEPAVLGGGHHNQAYGAPADEEQPPEQPPEPTFVGFNPVNWSSENASYHNGAN